MTEIEYNLRNAQANNVEAASKLRAAQIKLEQGRKKLQAEMEQSIAGWQQDVECAQANVTRTKAWLEVKQAVANKGFD